MKQQYIGFASSDKFLDAINLDEPVNLNVGIQAGPPDRRFGVSTDSVVLMMSQARWDSQEVLYFQDIPFRYRSVSGHVMEPDENRPSRLAGQVLAAAKQYLDDRAVTWREALLSMPRNYVVLTGASTFLQYDKLTDSFNYRKGEPV